MAASTLPHEPRLAMDLFDKQDLNIDGSGGLELNKLEGGWPCSPPVALKEGMFAFIILF